jgi:hypothetical protein
MISAPLRNANRLARGNLTDGGLASLSHTWRFSGSRQVQSGRGDVIKGQYGVELAGLKNKR